MHLLDSQVALHSPDATTKKIEIKFAQTWLILFAISTQYQYDNRYAFAALKSRRPSLSKYFNSTFNTSLQMHINTTEMC